MAFYLGNYHFLNVGAPALVAKAGGGQANATQITGAINLITTVGTIGDSVKLPQSQQGNITVVINGTANSANVFPFTGEAINALGANAAFALAAGKTAIFFCPVATRLFAVLSA